LRIFLNLWKNMGEMGESDRFGGGLLAWVDNFFIKGGVWICFICVFLSYISNIMLLK
jgi:hypothetical protein